MMSIQSDFIMVRIKSLFSKKVPVYEVVDMNGECACKKCNEFLNKFYSENNSLIRTAKIECIKKRENSDEN